MDILLLAGIGAGMLYMNRSKTPVTPAGTKAPVDHKNAPTGLVHGHTRDVPQRHMTAAQTAQIEKKKRDKLRLDGWRKHPLTITYG